MESIYNGPEMLLREAHNKKLINLFYYHPRDFQFGILKFNELKSFLEQIKLTSPCEHEIEFVDFLLYEMEKIKIEQDKDLDRQIHKLRSLKTVDDFLREF